MTDTPTAVPILMAEPTSVYMPSEHWGGEEDGGLGSGEEEGMVVIQDQ